MAANIQPIALVTTEGLYSLPLLPGQYEAASQTFLKGTPLVWSSGLIANAGTNPTAIVGISAYVASGVQNNPAQVIPVLKNLIFEITIDAASGGNAAGTGSLAQSAVGTTYGITKDGNSNLWYLDTGKSGGNQVLTLIGFQTSATSSLATASGTQAGVVNGRALVSFLASTSVWT